MSLTVPTSGSVAGRSANLNAIPDTTGESIGRFAEVVANVGIGLENDRLSRQANRLQVDMTRDLNNLNLETQSIGDPDVLDATWTQRSAELRQSYLTGTGPDGRPRVDPRNAERIGLAFDELSNRHALAVGARSLEARHSERLATDLALRNEIVTAGSTADPDTRAIYFDIYRQQQEENVAAGVISAEQAQANIIGIQADTTNAAAIRMIADDPEGFLTAADAGAFNDLGGETLSRYSVNAQSALDANDAALTREAQAQTDARAKDISDRLGEISDIAQAGRVPVDEAWLATPEVMASPDYPRARAAIDLRNEQPLLAQMTPTDLQAMVASEQANPIAYEWQDARLQLLKDQAAAAATGWSTDPLAYAASVGLVPAALQTVPPFDPANPGALATVLQGRRDLGQQFVAGGYVTGAARSLSEPERAQIVSQASIDTDPATRAAYAATLMSALPGRGPDSAGALIPDPVFLHMGSLVATGTNPAVAEAVFRGQQAIAAGNVILPTNATIIGAFGKTLGMIFGDIAGGEKEQARVRDAANALYADRVRTTNPANYQNPTHPTPIDAPLYAQALHEVMGGTGTVGNTDALGGLVKLNNVETVLPRGVSASLAESSIANLGYNAAGDWTPTTMVQQLTAASLNAFPPQFVADPNFWDQMQTAQFRAVGDDQYVIVFDTASGPRALQDMNGGEYRLSLRRMIQAVPQ